MATWGEQISFDGVKPHILVNGTLKDWEEVKASIQIKYDKQARIKRIYSQENGKPLEYLGGKKGLVECDRFKGDDIPVVTKISEEERLHILDLACEYERPDGTKDISRDHVLQVVTTKRDWGKVRFSNLLEGPDHSHIRIISPNKEVKTVGFVAFNSSKNVLDHGEGAIGTLDFGDLFRHGKQFVTNIAISSEELIQLKTIIREIREEKNTIYNAKRQNCCSFIKHVLSSLSLADFPEPIKLSRFLKNVIVHGKNSATPFSERLITEKSKDEKSQNIFVKVASAVLIAFTSLLMKPITVFLGDRPFKRFHSEDDALDNKVTRFFKWLIEPFEGNFPAQTIAWQQTVDTTELVVKKKKIAISNFPN